MPHKSHGDPTMKKFMFLSLFLLLSFESYCEPAHHRTRSRGLRSHQGVSKSSTHAAYNIDDKSHLKPDSLKQVARVYAPYLEGLSQIDDAQVENNIFQLLKKPIQLDKTKPTKNLDKLFIVFQQRYMLPTSSFLPNILATSQFCQSVDSTHREETKTANTAVCFVGSTRTLLRQDVQDSLLYRFYAGWGIQHMWTFAVLSDITHNRPPIEEFLDHLNTVALEWYEELSHPGRPCRESHEEMQLNQWAQCLGHIENYEKKENAKFDVVVKLRPDDLWYGAMLPHCVLNVRNTVYISRQKNRWSDQWFSLPRKLATPVLNMTYNEMRPRCIKGDGLSYWKPENGTLYYEPMIFSSIIKHATIMKFKIVDLLVPRALSRYLDEDEAKQTNGAKHSMKEVELKCEVMIWFVKPQDCASMLLGYDIDQYIRTNPKKSWPSGNKN